MPVEFPHRYKSTRSELNQLLSDNWTMLRLSPYYTDEKVVMS